MTRAFHEGHLRFTFDDAWRAVEKWDDSKAYRDGIGKFSGRQFCPRCRRGNAYANCGVCTQEMGTGSDAVDFVGVRNNRLHLIEVKDFRNHALETKGWWDGRLTLEIATKVRDTLAGLVAARLKGLEGALVDCSDRLLTSRPVVVAWVVDAAVRPAEPISKRRTRQGGAKDELKRKLAWLPADILMEDPFESALGVVTENLARPLP